MEKITLTIPTTNGNEEVKAVKMNDLFCIHIDIYENEKSFIISHIPTGLRLCKLNNSEGAIQIAKRLFETLSENQRELWRTQINKDPKWSKNRHCKAVAKYVQAAVKCENNRELEKMVGVFYRDRESAERLRLKINPEHKTLLDDNALGSERLTASLIMGEINLK